MTRASSRVSVRIHATIHSCNHAEIDNWLAVELFGPKIFFNNFFS